MTRKPSEDALSELLAIVSTGEFEDLGQMNVVHVHWSADRLDVTAHVDDGKGDGANWRLRFRGVLDQSFTIVTNCGLNVWREDHPAIDQYLDAREFLHFGSAPADADAVVGRLWTAHAAVAGDWVPFDRYLNRELPLDELLRRRAGLLATGPAFLIAAYSEVLEEEGCGPISKRLRGWRRISAATLTHFGESYVVAEEVTARRLPA